jgi:hypothetical protein
MTRDELEHAIRAAGDVSSETTLIVFGSQAILGQYPNAHEDLRQSMEADVAPGSGDEHVARMIDGALGEGSQFHQNHGFYLHGLTSMQRSFQRDGSGEPSASRPEAPTEDEGSASKRTTSPRASL